MTDGGTADAPATTGDPRVDVQLARLQDLDNLDLPAQLDVFTDLQAELSVILDSSDETEAAEETEAATEAEPEVDDSTLRSPAS